MKSAVDNHLSEFTSMEANTRHTYAQITTKMMIIIIIIIIIIIMKIMIIAIMIK